MQVCPCIRLRLRLQYQRNWRHARPLSTSPAARNIAGTDGTRTSDDTARTPYIGLAEASAAGEADKATGKSAYWSQYADLWIAASEAVGVSADRPAARAAVPPEHEHPAQRAQLAQPARQEARPERPQRAPKRVRWQAAPPKAPPKAPPRKLRPRRSQADLDEHGFFRRRTPAEQYLRANAAFWKWKQALAETWQLLAAGQLPRQVGETATLQSLLAAGQDATDGTDGTGHVNIEAMRQAWQRLRPERRRDLSTSVMADVLQTHPGQAHRVFAAIFDAAEVPYYLAQDVLGHFARQLHVCAPDSGLHPTAEELLALVRMVLAHSPANYVRLRQATIFFMLQALDSPAATLELQRLLTAYGHPLHKHTRLQIAGRLAGRAAFKAQAIAVLQAAQAETDLDINTIQGAALCTAILSTREATKTAGTKPTMTTTTTPTDDTPTPAEMFEQLLRCGLEPNLITYTTIIRGLCLKEELEAARQVLQLMVHNQTDPDEYVYGTMMNGAKQRGDFALLRQVAETAAAAGIRHAVVWNDFLQALHGTAFAEARANRDAKRPRVVPAFPLMLQTFRKTFAAAPLQVLLPEAVGRARSDSHDDAAETLLGADYRDAHDSSVHSRWRFAAKLAPTVHTLPQLDEAARIPPTGLTLTTMVLGYLQGLSNPYDVIAFYAHFRRLLQAGHPVAADLVREQGTLVHDMVVMALCEREGMLRAALDVVGDMLKEGPVRGGQDGEHDDRLTPDIRHPAPSIYTWSILLNGFLFHRQLRQGERILHMMRERGVEPNQVTWNTLVAGYARLQNVRKTAGALQRLEQAGFEPDDFTFRAFSYLCDKSAILQQLEQRKARQARQAATTAAATATAAAAAAENEQQARQTLPAEPSAGRPAETLPSAGFRSLGTPHELRGLAHEVEEIAKMMDEEQSRGLA